MEMSVQEMRDSVTFQWPRNPYPGLRPFRDDEALIFYGRNSHKDEILARLNASQLVFVTGPSGCGKSSLIRAGVLPALQAGLLTKAGYHWKTTQMRPGRRPLVNLATAFEYLETLESDADAGRPHRGGFGKLFDTESSALWVAANQIAQVQNASLPQAAPIRILLLIDQFEEIFGEQIQDARDVDRFVRLLVRFAERPHPNLYVVVTMRSDFVGQCANFEGLAEIINRTQFLTPALPQDKLYQAIARPTEDYNGEVEEELADQMIRDMRTGTAYHSDNLPLMQHALLWIWSRAWKEAGAPEPPRPPFENNDNITKLTLAVYQDNDGMGGILDRHAETVLNEAVGNSAARQSIAECVFRRLTERDPEGRYRRSPASAEELCTIAGCDLHELQQVIRPFEHPDVCFLEQRPSLSADEILVDISHESLIRQWTRAKKWADAEADKVRKFRELAQAAITWENRGRSHGFLKSRGELEVIQDWWKAEKPDLVWARRYSLDSDDVNFADAFPRLEEYLRVSSETDRTERRALELAHIRKASEKSRRQRNRVLAIAVFLLLVSALTAVSLVWQRSETNAYRVRVTALLADEALHTVGPAGALLIAMQGIDQHLPPLTDIERATYRALAQLRERYILKHNGPVQSIEFSPLLPSGRRLLMTTSTDGLLRFWNPGTGDLVAAPAYLTGGKSLVARWSPDGTRLFISPRAGEAFFVVPCESDKLREFFPKCGSATVNQTEPFKGAAGAGTFSPNGKWIVTSGYGSTTTKLWDASSLEEIADFGPTSSWMGVVAFSHDSQRLAFGSSAGEIRIFRITDDLRSKNPTLERTIKPSIDSPLPQHQTASASPGSTPGSSPPVASLAFHPHDSNALLATLQDGTVRFWSNISDNNPTVLRARQSMVFQGVFNHDGEWAATAHEDRTVRLWPLKADPPRTITLRGHRGNIFSVAYSPDGQLIASGSSDTTARLWSQQSALGRTKLDLPAQSDASGEAVEIFESAGELKLKIADRELVFTAPANFGEPSAAAISRSGEHILIVPKHGRPYLFNAAAKEYIVALPGRPEAWRRAAFANDRMIAVTTDGEAYGWPYFPDLKTLKQFAGTQLPFEDGKPMRIRDDIACRIDVKSASVCTPSPDAGAQE
jgi:WD40 repeat protein/energy-coupling factor transporter ATP-binding protein EcfA2